MKHLLLILLMAVSCFGFKEKLGGYIFNDIDTSFQYQSRLNYQEQLDDSWEAYSQFLIDINFPRINRYFNVSPVFQSMHSYRHLSNTDHATSRLTQAYLDVMFQSHFISIGSKRIQLQQGKFIGDSSFSQLPKSFGQISMISNDEKWGLYYLNGYTPANTDISVQYDKGSIVAYHLFQWSPSFKTTLYTYLIEDSSDTFSAESNYTLSPFQSISFSYAYQDAPIIKTTAQENSNSYFYDAIYSIDTIDTQIDIGVRAFGGGSTDSANGFSAPLSSGHSWDGYLNQYLSSVKTGFTDGQRIYFTSFQQSLFKFNQFGISAYLFRGLQFGENQGAEIDIKLSNQLLSESMFWTYKTGYFFKGTDGASESEYRMWLDIIVKLGKAPE